MVFKRSITQLCWVRKISSAGFTQRLYMRAEQKGVINGAITPMPLMPIQSKCRWATQCWLFYDCRNELFSGVINYVMTWCNPSCNGVCNIKLLDVPMCLGPSRGLKRPYYQMYCIWLSVRSNDPFSSKTFSSISAI